MKAYERGWPCRGRGLRAVPFECPPTCRPLLLLLPLPLLPLLLLLLPLPPLLPPPLL